MLLYFIRPESAALYPVERAKWTSSQPLLSCREGNQEETTTQVSPSASRVAPRDSPDILLLPPAQAQLQLFFASAFSGAQLCMSTASESDLSHVGR